jgi:hypothetical protein
LLTKLALYFLQFRNFKILHNSLLPLFEIFRLLNAAVMFGASSFDKALVNTVVELRSFSDCSSGCKSLGGENLSIADRFIDRFVMPEFIDVGVEILGGEEELFLLAIFRNGAAFAIGLDIVALLVQPRGELGKPKTT